MTDAAGILDLAELGRHVETVFDSGDFALPNVQVFGNAPPSVAALLQPAYAARTARPAAVSLVALPSGAMLHGGGLFLLSVAGLFAREQIRPDLLGNVAELRQQAGAARDCVEIREPSLLVARYGERTWGHWLCELLPKIAAAEARWPGRFRYVLPQVALRPESAGVVADRIVESLAAYGVGLDRVLEAASDLDYRFAALHAMTSVWTDRLMHPHVMALMADTVRVYPVQGHGRLARVALLRSDNARRQIDNMEDVRRVLDEHGVVPVDIGLLSFSEQVTVFRNAELLFSVLGSSLSGLVYAPARVGVLAAAPEHFTDDFFYALMQVKHARYAEVRGPAVPDDTTLYRDRSFLLDTGTLRTALETLRAGA